MKTKPHSPSPWLVDRKSNGQFGVVSQPVLQGPGIGRFRVAVIGSAASPGPFDEANAHLISAAPELLAHLERVVETITCDCGGTHNTDCPRCGAEHAIRKARGL